MARNLPKKLRFEILKRDQFRCRYCGRGEADGAKLHVDHVIPVLVGGRNDPENLATACADCNLGKSARMLNNARIIGIDFVEQKKIFDTANESLERYREYLGAKDRWEYELVSEIILPLKPVFAMAEPWRLNEFSVYWHYEFGFDLPPETRPRSFPPEAYAHEAALDNFQHAEARIRRSVLHFVEKLGPDQVREAARIAAEKVLLDHEMLDDEGDSAFRYFCGVCYRRIRARGGEQA